VRKDGTWLKTTLVQCAWAVVEKKDSYLQAQFYRIKARRGPKKAIMAVVASILTAIYHMLKDGTMYEDLGSPSTRRARSRPWIARSRACRSRKAVPAP
jgi:transposase